MKGGASYTSRVTSFVDFLYGTITQSAAMQPTIAGTVLRLGQVVETAVLAIILGSGDQYNV
jgi:hypothetical protein